MKSSAKTNQLIEQISLLDHEEKVKIATKILSIIKQENDQNSNAAQLNELKGLGSEMWKNRYSNAFSKD